MQGVCVGAPPCDLPTQEVLTLPSLHPVSSEHFHQPQPYNLTRRPRMKQGG